MTDLTLHVNHARAERGLPIRLTSDASALGTIGIVADQMRAAANFRNFFNPKGVTLVKYLVLLVGAGVDGVKVDPDLGQLVTCYETYTWNPDKWHVIVSFTANIPLNALSNNLCFYAADRLQLVVNTNSTIYSVYWYTKLTLADVTTANTLYATIIFIEKP